MSRGNIPDFAFTTGPKPDWESDVDYGDMLRTVAKSGVVLHSLRQSRERWLSDTFPRFSFRTRGKNNDPQPPPYTPSSRGKCDLKIGPHIFPDTTFFEMHYKEDKPVQPAAPAPPTPKPQPTTGAWQARTNTSYGVTSYATSASMATSQPTPPPAIRTTGTPATSTSLSPSTDISQALITKVNEAAASNPTLASLLQQAAAGTATPEQLNTLGVLIQQLASPPEPTPAASTSLASTETPTPLPHPPKQQEPVVTAPTAPAPPPPPEPPEKPFDLVIEFKERSQERWLIPRVPVVLKRDENAGGIGYNVTMEVQLPFDTSMVAWLSKDGMDKVPLEPKQQQLVTFMLKQPPHDVWETLQKWVGDTAKQKQNQKVLKKTAKHNRVFLSHTLPQSPLLVALQAASQFPYPLKTLKPTANIKAKPRRKPPPKPSKEGAPVPLKEGEEGKETPSKRRKTQVEKKTSPMPIHCLHCKKTDVPLIQGGRYCRPCVELGHTSSQPASSPATLAAQPDPVITTTESNTHEMPTNNP